MKKIVQVPLGDRSYEIQIEPAGLTKLGQAMTRCFGRPKRALVVTNDVVGPLYLDAVMQSLRDAGWQAEACVLPDGEQEKTIARWAEVIDALMQMRLARDEVLVALGGGVIGDLAGFAAACYRRGIAFVQVPTSLLAQVDSSVGGKTAVNHPLGKNMIGAFHQPSLVWIDPEVLHTLPRRELRAGLAEVIKYGLIRDAAFFAWLLEEGIEKACALDQEALLRLIARSCEIKAEIVAADETERGERALLNLGHTFGHAIERLIGYGRWLHGEAVGVGLRMAARLSARLGYLDPAAEDEIVAALVRAGLPEEPPSFAVEDWLGAIGHDKKAVGTKIRYVLLRRLGDAFLAEDVPQGEVIALLQSFGAK